MPADPSPFPPSPHSVAPRAQRPHAPAAPPDLGRPSAAPFPQRTLQRLRAAMMWLGVVLHVCALHMTASSPLPWHDERSAAAADLVVAAVHAFRVPVLLILAGFVGALLVQRCGLGGMARIRMRSLGRPLAVFWPVLFVASALLGAVYLHRMAHGTWGPDRAGLLQGLGIAQAPALHLWFLWMLLWLTLLTPAAWAIARALPPAMHRFFLRAMAWLGGSPLGILVLTLPLAWAAADYDHGIVTPSGSLLPEWQEWVHAGMFYTFGLGLHAQRQALLARYERQWPVLAALGLLCFLLAGVLAEALTQPEASVVALVLATGAFTDWLAAPAPATQSLQFWRALAYNGASWLWCLALMGAFLRHGRRPRAWACYLAQSAYWAYLVHLPVVLGMGALLYGAALPAVAKILINLLATASVCLASYHFAVRFTAVRELLHGPRQPHPTQGNLSHAL